jgi:putative transposase
LLREEIRVMAQALMELEVSQYVAPEKHERTGARTGQRNGYWKRGWDTRVGSTELRLPRVRDGGFFPALLASRTRGERALAAEVQEAHVQGVSTRRLNDVVRALAGPNPYTWLGATFVQVRQEGLASRAGSMAVVIAVGCAASRRCGTRQLVSRRTALLA